MWLQGTFHHNLRVIKCESGQIIVVSRQGEEEDCSHDDYPPHIHHLRFLKRKDLQRQIEHTISREVVRVLWLTRTIIVTWHAEKLQTNKIITVTVNMPPERVHSSKRVVETMKSHQVTHRMKWFWSICFSHHDGGRSRNPEISWHFAKPCMSAYVIERSRKQCSSSFVLKSLTSLCNVSWTCPRLI